MESDRYKLTVLFLKTFFRSWALSVKLNTHTNRQGVSSMLSAAGTFNDPYTQLVPQRLQTGRTCQLLLQTPCGETRREGGRGKNEVCVCVWLNDLKQRVGHKAFEVRQTNMQIYVFVCFLYPYIFYLVVCVCVQSAGFGTVAR